MGDDVSWHPDPDLIDFTQKGARQELEKLGEATWRLALDYLYGEALTRPVGPDSYPELRRRLFGPGLGPSPAPEEPEPAAEVLDEVRSRLLPYMFNSQHPRAFSYFTPPPLLMSIAGELLAQWFHQGIDVFHAGPAGALVEEEVTSWLRELTGQGEDSWAVLTSGGVMANVMALTVARDRHLAGLLGLDRPPRGGDLDGVRVYVSDQAHFSIGRALDVLGFPPRTLSIIESDDRFKLRADAVNKAVASDRSKGLLPFCIAAVSGSTNTGSVDDVPGLASVAEAERLWLHVDAAYGGAARLSGRDASRGPGLELADSVTIDPHKWFFQAYDIGALVVRHREELHRTFLSSPEYYRTSLPETHPLNWMEYSIEGTRRFRALKLWMSWKHLGTSGLARLVEHDNDVAAWLSAELAAADDFDTAVREPELSVVCFRHLPGGAEHAAQMAPAALDAHQDHLQRALEVSGLAWVSTTTLRGRTYLRAGVMNYLSTTEDAQALLDALRQVAGTLTETAGGEPT